MKQLQACTSKSHPTQNRLNENSVREKFSSTLFFQRSIPYRVQSDRLNQIDAVSSPIRWVSFVFSE